MIYVDFSNIPISNMPTSARQVGEMAAKEEKRRDEKAAADATERKRQKKVDDAQLNSEENLRKMLEMMKANQKEQAIESKKTKMISIWGLIISGITLAATIIFGILQVTR